MGAASMRVDGNQLPRQSCWDWDHEEVSNVSKICVTWAENIVVTYNSKPPGLLRQLRTEELSAKA